MWFYGGLSCDIFGQVDNRLNRHLLMMSSTFCHQVLTSGIMDEYFTIIQLVEPLFTVNNAQSRGFHTAAFGELPPSNCFTPQWLAVSCEPMTNQPDNQSLLGIAILQWVKELHVVEDIIHTSGPSQG